MLELVSVILSAMSVYQSFNKDSKHEDVLIQMNGQLLKIDIVYQMLKDAKTIHNGCEDFSKINIEEIVNSILDITDITIKHKKVERLLDYYNSFIKECNPNKIQIVFEESKVQYFTYAIRENLEKIDLFYNEMYNELNELKKVFKKIVQMDNNQNYGKTFTPYVAIIETKIKTILNAADKSIINTAPILDYLHTELKNSIERVL